MNENYFSKNLVEKLSFPRLPGTNGEKKAQGLIETELKNLNIDGFQKQAFEYTTFFMNFLLRIYNFLVGLLMIVTLAFLVVNLFLLVFLFAAVLFVFSFYSRQIREKIQFKLTRIGKKRKSFNYIVDILPKSNENKVKPKQTLVVFAHYDSISMKLHPVFAGAIYLFALLGGTIFAFHITIISILYLLNILDSILLIQFIYGLFLVGLYSIQLFNSRGNESYGTIDNATSVASAFKVINRFYPNQNRLENTHLIVVFTGAEEMGDCGANSFIEQRHSEFDNDTTFFLIPDSVGADEKTNLYAYAEGFPKKLYSPRIKSEIETLLKKKSEEYKMKPMYIPPLIHFSTDHAPLKRFGYEFMIFLSSGRIHSEKDNLDNYYPEILESFNAFFEDLIIQMDLSIEG
ncbi:MAG: M20/M25/M40 family metallo-hydrolase [Candidatus Lokiarchaeota archaeon]|nr:M20/M25/M40 family metallo-hydrolase [Candidatus Lokiarchaeota archaeon]MBD3340354.1 M20/M25/M40 family metallo-hydrolase [Candidatus Lokiarchaeota archaeon]